MPRRVAKCHTCDLVGKISGKDKEGKPICRGCYDKYIRLRKVCSNCKKLKFHDGTSPEGLPVCGACYCKLGMKPQKVCDECGKTSNHAGTNESGKPVCDSCYRKLGLRPKITCSNCQTEAYHNGSSHDNKPLCRKCFIALGLQLLKECSECGEMRPQNGQTSDGEPVCLSCYAALKLQPHVQCARCKRMKPRADTDENGDPICKSCYKPYLCDVDGCEHKSSGPVVAAQHARTHGPWKGKSTMEEWVHIQLTQHGFQQAWPHIDPEEPPVSGTFWYNARTFSALIGVGGRRLECDFMIGLPKGPKWIELNGLHHYEQVYSVELFETQKQHDELRRKFALHTLPEEQKTFSGLTFEEVPHFEFPAWKAKFNALLADGEAKEDPATSKRQATEDPETASQHDKPSKRQAKEDLEASPSKRQKTADEVMSSSSHQSSMLDYFTTTVASITVASSP